jgi:DNA-binding transcriptional MocR family regulator
MTDCGDSHTPVRMDRTVWIERATQLANSEAETAPRTEGVMAAIRRRMLSRALTAGEKLPSIRRLARDMQVSPSTVVEAYDRLAAEGLIRSRPGSGFYVAGSPPPAIGVPFAHSSRAIARPRSSSQNMTRHSSPHGASSR